ncbi:MAG: DoxX family protein [Bacteroidetes bacterium]|nr:DoxX family protein [Bacteroidota bacterium]
MKTIYFKITQTLSNLNDIPLLLIRLILAYGFYSPAMTKIKDVNAIVEWFQSIEMPAPTLNAYLATYTELLGFIFLTLGFATRFISIPLIITMIVAIKTVHWENGFNASDNGYEIPLYYIIMLVTLLFSGAGKLSIDYLIGKKLNK